MKKLSQCLLTVFITVLLVFAFSGCGGNSKKDVDFVTPISGWEDITLPVNSKFVRTNISGKVENHEFTTPFLTQIELLNYLEEAMASQDWTLESSTENARSFIKNENHVQFTIKDPGENGTNVFIIIEPKDAYGPPVETTNQ